MRQFPQYWVITSHLALEGSPDVLISPYFSVSFFFIKTAVNLHRSLDRDIFAMVRTLIRHYSADKYKTIASNLYSVVVIDFVGVSFYYVSKCL